MGVLLNEKQNEAVKKAIYWYFNESNYKKLFCILGVAGSGKTFLARIIIDCLGLTPYQVIFAAPTGKAAEVLRRKGCQANTVHRTFYSIYKINNKIKFKKKRKLSTQVKLVILDELSMINDRMMKDVLSFEIPIIALGDNAQLPPIYGSNRYVNEPDIMLTEIMRQKGDIGVLNLAQMSRKGEYIPFGKYIESEVIYVNEIKNIERYDIILCWKNITRQNINVLLRDILGYTSVYPGKGEKLICLKNNYVHMLEYNDIPIFLVNGMDLICGKESAPDKLSGDKYIELSYRPGYTKDLSFKTRVHKGPFDSYRSGNVFIMDEAVVDEDVVFLDFGYAYTVHKSQGSEFDKVLVIDEFKGDNKVYNKWLYTAITRARKSVTIARYI
jgi:exodeoxyribonuclease-5